MTQKIDAKIDVRALANLVRLEVSDADVAKFESELPGIMQFVDQIQAVDVSHLEAQSPEHRNIMRKDEDANETGAMTKILLEAAPAQEKSQIVVRQVVTRKK